MLTVIIEDFYKHHISKLLGIMVLYFAWGIAGFRPSAVVGRAGVCPERPGALSAAAVTV